MKKSTYRSFSLFMLALTVAVIGATFLSDSHTAQAAGFRSHQIKVQPHAIYAGEFNPAAPTFRCQLPQAAVHCYGPDQIRNAYAIQPLLNAGITGKGRKIVIVDAFQSPTLKTDLALFDKTFGMPAPELNIIAPDGLLPFDPSDPNQVGWSGEINLDVEWAHAVAPDATINLVLARTNDDTAILNALKYAVDNNLGDTISQSFGEAESCVDPALTAEYHKVYEAATLKHITLFASSGDQGAAQPSCDGSTYILSASSPATDPNITAVGGTQLTADLTTGKYISEVTWNEPNFEVATGGGYSTVYTRRGFQAGTVPGNWRAVPDVAYNAAINGGVLTAWQGNIYIFGGTSAGSPQWAGILALANQKAGKRLGFLNNAIYKIGKSPEAYKQGFHDITAGNNTFTSTDAAGNPVTIEGYNASKGWDPVTGWGSPIVSNLVNELILFVDN